MVFEKAKALKQDILEFRSLQENELSYWSISFKDYGLAFIGKKRFTLCRTLGFSDYKL